MIAPHSPEKSAVKLEDMTVDQIVAALDADFNEYIKDKVAHLEWKPVPGTKATEFVRFGPLVAHAFPRGLNRGWIWRLYGDGFSKPQTKGRELTEVKAKVAAMVEIYKRFTSTEGRR